MKRIGFIGVGAILPLLAIAMSTSASTSVVSPENPVDYGIEKNMPSFSNKTLVFPFSKTFSEMEIHTATHKSTGTTKTTQVVVVTQILVPDDATKPFKNETYFLPGAG